MRGWEAQPARRADVDGDRRVMRPFPLDHPLDKHRSGMGHERTPAGGKPRPAASGLQQCTERSHGDPADAVLAEMRKRTRAGQHASPVGNRMLNGDQRGLLTAWGRRGVVQGGRASCRERV